MFLNGIDPSKVLELVKHYDIDGDGQISFSEFSELLLSRNSNDKNDWITVDHLISNNTTSNENNSSPQDRLRQDKKVRENRYFDDENNEDNISDSTSLPISMINPNTTTSMNNILYKTKVYLKNLKAMFVKRVIELRQEGKLRSIDLYGMHTTKLCETVTRRLMMKSFRPFQGNSKAMLFSKSIFTKYTSSIIYIYQFNNYI